MNASQSIVTDLGLDYNYAHHLQLEIPTEAQFPKSMYSAKNYMHPHFFYIRVIMTNLIYSSILDIYEH